VYYAHVVGIEWAASAHKHGIAREDALHAMTNAYYVDQEFDEPRPPANLRPTLYIGPPRLLGGPLLEVMAVLSPPRGMFVFHVMEARPKMLKLMKKDEDV
jgi:hypothetical protein